MGFVLIARNFNRGVTIRILMGLTWNFNSRFAIRIAPPRRGLEGHRSVDDSSGRFANLEARGAGTSWRADDRSHTALRLSRSHSLLPVFVLTIVLIIALMSRSFVTLI